ncbi:DegT/DnrJ/EryC1/StrS family aminotransferase [Altererythrobacter sp. Root672]|uniref:DegT/DnrJ/EryC1/StrS family aminotransferase n=1 Tax=Altererythrobacter sp. Root672 TaxID=1736584 RepID=UPI0006F8FC3A|nr:DegT/DnrJ/EryC1/StrS family aminotransferase [Altererythrobacter sp. Root672]KRA83611.1 aminotransferase [Altererythrobacter sp. Root672]
MKEASAAHFRSELPSDFSDDLSTADHALPPVRSQWPRHEDDEIDAVAEVLRTGQVNSLVHGKQNALFAREFASYIGMDHAFCVANGTVSLELALRALDVGPGDEVIVPARSFFATASCVLASGAMPVFADVLPDSQNIDPVSVERLIGARTRAIICVHLAGWPCDMRALVGLAEKYGLFLIEDCAQAHGAEIEGRRVGSFGDISSFSFCTDKIMSTGGEGGMVLFKDRRHHDIAWSYKDHGKNPAKLTDGKGVPGEFRYIHDGPGSNYRLTEMQAAIGRKQLRRLPEWLDCRARNVEVLTTALEGHPSLDVFQPPASVRSAWYKFYVQLRERLDEPIQHYRARVIAKLTAKGIPVATGSCPDMSKEEAFAGLPIRKDGVLPAAAGLAGRTLMFPVDHTLSEADMARIADSLVEALA